MSPVSSMSILRAPTVTFAGRSCRRFFGAMRRRVPRMCIASRSRRGRSRRRVRRCGRARRSRLGVRGLRMQPESGSDERAARPYLGEVMRELGTKRRAARRVALPALLAEKLAYDFAFVSMSSIRARATASVMSRTSNWRAIWAAWCVLPRTSLAAAWPMMAESFRRIAVTWMSGTA